MSGSKDTINTGGATGPTQDEREYDVTGSVAEKGEEPSPRKRERGEGASADTGGALDAGTAHDRAS